jgi:hypothetical protein
VGSKANPRTAQFLSDEFSPSRWTMNSDGPDDGFESSIGGYFRIKYPIDWLADDQYEFDWKNLSNDTDPFQNFPYNSI